MLSNEKFITEETAWQSSLLMIKEAYKRNQGNKQPWTIIFDTTHRRRFGKLLKNMVCYKGPKNTKTYAFVWPLLLSPNGERISLPVMQWYSRQYAKDNNIRRKTQPRLVVLTLQYLSQRLEQAGIFIDLVILGDRAFECKALWNACQKHNFKHQTKWVMITTCHASRCLGANDEKATLLDGQKIVDQFDNEAFTCSRRINPQRITKIELRSKRKYKQRLTSHFYRYASKNLCVSKLGICKVVMSYKLNQPCDDLSSSPRQVFLCSDTSFSALQIVAYYTLRWECETFFREHKSSLAFNHLQAWNFRSCYAFVNVLSATFNFLEFFRLKLLDKNPCSLDIRFARVAKLKELFSLHSQSQSLLWIYQRSFSNFGKRRIQKLINDLYSQIACF